MKLSAKGSYACVAVIVLAQGKADGTPVKCREIAARSGIPDKFLARILVRLTTGGIIESCRGSGGGYRLRRPAEDISLAEILDAIGELATGGDPSPLPSALALRTTLVRASGASRAVLAETSIAQLAGEAAAPNWVI